MATLQTVFKSSLWRVGIFFIVPVFLSSLDVVIPAAPKDRHILPLSIRAIRKQAKVGRVIVVSKERLTGEAEWVPESTFPFTLREVAEVLSHGDDSLKERLVASRAGWYFQQLLKLYAPLVIPKISSNVLVLDADTIFLRPVSFFTSRGQACYAYTPWCHAPYIAHARRLVPGFVHHAVDKSGVTHHMLFQRPVIEALLRTVERHHKKPFWHCFCALVDRKELFSSGASEYEIYFNFAFMSGAKIALRKLRARNISGVEEIRAHRRRGFDTVSIHTYVR